MFMFLNKARGIPKQFKKSTVRLGQQPANRVMRIKSINKLQTGIEHKLIASFQIWSDTKYLKILNSKKMLLVSRVTTELKGHIIRDMVIKTYFVSISVASSSS